MKEIYAPEEVGELLNDLQKPDLSGRVGAVMCFIFDPSEAGVGTPQSRMNNASYVIIMFAEFSSENKQLVLGDELEIYAGGDLTDKGEIAFVGDAPDLARFIDLLRERGKLSPARESRLGHIQIIGPDSPVLSSSANVFRISANEQPKSVSVQLDKRTCEGTAPTATATPS
ncbi:MAG: hypothetical protein P4M13_11670 [Alphaproteobacteria bacterium]|nr:hypothetical protein [Alphaproteobacteria bacterium]